MNPVTHVLLFGSLARFHRGIGDEALELDLKTPTGIQDVLELLRIPAQEVSLAMLNFRSVPKDFEVRPGVRLSLFPREYPIFADWIDHRF
jgi:Mut7-C ubiquitin